MPLTTDTKLPQRIIHITTCVCGNNSIQQYDSMMRIDNNEPTNTIHYTCCNDCLSLELEGIGRGMLDNTVFTTC